MYLEMHVYFTLCKMLHVPNVRVIEKGQLEYEGHQYGGESHLKFDYVGPWHVLIYKMSHGIN